MNAFWRLSCKPVNAPQYWRVNADTAAFAGLNASGRAVPRKREASSASLFLKRFDQYEARRHGPRMAVSTPSAASGLQ
jgi:hypothetical protein